MQVQKIILITNCLFVLILSSCVSNKISSENPKRQILVQTHDGHTFDLPWYEVKDGVLVSKLNTSRIVLYKEQIIEAALSDQKAKKVPIDEAIEHNGSIYVLAFDAGQRVHHYEFYNMEKIREHYVGYTFTNGYAADIRIPLYNVKSIEVEKIHELDETTKKVIGWSIYVTLELIWLYYGYPASYWIY